jgi:hypothetical protein
MTPFSIVRHLAGSLKTSPASAIGGRKRGDVFQYCSRRESSRLITPESGDQCADYVLIAGAPGTDGFIEERQIALFDAT